MRRTRSRLLSVIFQVIGGPRGVLKMGQVWLPLGLILAGGTRTAPEARLSTSLYLLLAVVCKGLSSILFNDLADREADAAAGKRRWIASLPSPAGISIPVVLLVAAALALVLAGGRAAVMASFAATALLGVAYSLKPVRFKDRGLWGVWAYAFSAAILHGLVPWTLFRPALMLLPLLTAVVLTDKLVQILFHQMVDLEADEAGKVGSWAVVAGREKTERTLRAAVFIAVAVEGAVLFYVLYALREYRLHLWLAAGVAALGIVATWLYVAVISKRRGTSTELTGTLPWPYLGLSYVLFHALPPFLFSALAGPDPRMWILAGLSALWLLGRTLNYVAYDPSK